MNKINQFLKRINYNYLWKLIHIICFIILFVLLLGRLNASIYGFSHPYDMHLPSGEELLMQTKAKEKDKEKKKEKEQKKKEKKEKEKK